MSNNWIEQANKSCFSFHYKWELKQPKHDELGRRDGHASVVLDDNTILLIGGSHVYDILSSTLVLPSNSPVWIQGPDMNVKRSELTAVVCDGAVYAIGGFTHYTAAFGSTATLERITIAALKRIVASPPRNKNDKWEKVNARLSSDRSRCAAVAVHDRFIVVMGGCRCDGPCLSTVDIIDTMMISTTDDYNGFFTPAVVSAAVGPRMSVPRQYFGAVVLGNRVWVVGGRDDHCNRLGTVESLSFNDWNKTNDSKKEESTSMDESTRKKTKLSPESSSSMLFSSSSSWTVHTKIKLAIPRYNHATCLVAKCLVVAGGYGSGLCLLNSVEVLDLERHVVWKLPDLSFPRSQFCMVSVSNELLVLGGWSGSHVASIESLAFVELSLAGIERALRELGKLQLLSLQQSSEATGTHRFKKLRLEGVLNTLLYFHLTTNNVTPTIFFERASR